MNSRVSDSRRVLFDIEEFRERGFLHEPLEESPGMEPIFAFEVTLAGVLFHRDDLGYWMRSKAAGIRFMTYTKFDPESQLDHGSKPILGWVDREDDQLVAFCLRLHVDYAKLLIDRVERASAAANTSCSLEFVIRTRDEYRAGEKTGDYITGIYFDRPSQQEHEKRSNQPVETTDTAARYPRLT